MYEVGGRSAKRLRGMYPGGRAGTTARRYARFWSAVFRFGLLPRRWVVLETIGRKSGNPVRLPLGMARHGGRWYLVSMLGECNWTRNVRAAGGSAAILRIRRHPVRLVEVEEAERGPIIRDYLRQVPGGRPHIPVDPDAPEAAFDAVAAAHPVFAITPLTPESVQRRSRQPARW